MCGVFGYIGDKHAYPIIIDGLLRLEYRGYDSSGIALLEDSNLHLVKKCGKVQQLIDFVQTNNISLKANIGIGHTRWATHGEPSDKNAHPHISENKKIALIHNGVIENYSTIKKELLQKGYKFQSDTDSEVLVHFIQDIQENIKESLEEAIKIVLNKVVGAYSILVISKDDPNQIIAAKRGSSLVIGVGQEGDYFISSDPASLIKHTQSVIYLNDCEIACIKKDELRIFNFQKNLKQKPYIDKLELELESIEKGGYEHFMLKEIFEQPNSIQNSFRGRFDIESKKFTLKGLERFLANTKQIDRVIILGCGTSWHAGLVAEYIIEEVSRIPVEIEYASEFRYRNPVITQNDMIIPISQSGETKDTLAAIELAKTYTNNIFGVCNVVGSSIAKVCGQGSYLHAGPEIGVASTKAFTSQVSTLVLIALKLALVKKVISEDYANTILEALYQVPSKIKSILNQSENILHIAKKFKDAKNFLYLGRGINFPVALEGALKLKEISYIHAEGYPAAEMKHGPIALIDEDMPVVFIALKDKSYEKIISNIQEVKARKGKVIAIVNEGEEEIQQLADYTISIPKTEEIISSLLSVVPLQLLSYHIAVLRGCDVDKPRNLAKSVTVE